MAARRFFCPKPWAFQNGRSRAARAVSRARQFSRTVASLAYASSLALGRRQPVPSHPIRTLPSQSESVLGQRNCNYLHSEAADINMAAALANTLGVSAGVRSLTNPRSLSNRKSTGARAGRRVTPQVRARASPDEESPCSALVRRPTRRKGRISSASRGRWSHRDWPSLRVRLLRNAGVQVPSVRPRALSPDHREPVTATRINFFSV